MLTCSVHVCLSDYLELGSGLSSICIRRWEVEICSIGGTKIQMHKIPEVAESMDKSKYYIIMCKTGRRAESVANLLECAHGFQHVAILEGGITAWFETFEPTYEMY